MILRDVPTILVAEDDPLIQIMVEEALREGGFETRTVASGEQAVALLKGDNEYRVLVTDIHLQGKLDGWDVARTAREIDPAFLVVYMTGRRANGRPRACPIASCWTSRSQQRRS